VVIADKARFHASATNFPRPEKAICLVTIRGHLSLFGQLKFQWGRTISPGREFLLSKFASEIDCRAT
jgi:hypothetical protein